MLQAADVLPPHVDRLRAHAVLLRHLRHGPLVGLARAFLQRATVKVPADFSGERLEVTCNRTAPRSDCARALGRELEVAMRGLGSKRLKVPVRNH